MPSWLQAAVDHAMDPIVNGIASAFIAVVAGLVISALFRLVGQPLLNRILIPLFRSADHVLVSYIAPITGIGLVRPVHRWLCFIGAFLALAVIAVFAPVFIAIGAVFTGIIVVLSIYRAWERDEQERQVEEDNGRDHQQENDYGNEILAGLLFLIIFFTLGFVRLSEQETIYRGQAVVPIATTAAFVWGEILKGVPLVDASEVYGLGNMSGLEADGGLGRGLTFVFRVFLDLVLIASLLRLVTIINRRAAGQDLRDVRAQYASSDTGRINAALDQLLEFALRGGLNAQVEIERIALRERDVPALKDPKILLRAGDMLQDLSDKFGGMKFLLPAVEAYKAALEATPRETAPEDWGLAQNNLGTALATLGGISGDVPRLQEAADAFRTLLEVRTREATPAGWALTQANLGNSLEKIGRITGNVPCLEEAVEAFKAALEVRSREAMPSDWAGSQSDLGLALETLGRVTGDVPRLENAVQAYKAALSVFTRGYARRLGCNPDQSRLCSDQARRDDRERPANRESDQWI